MTLLSFTVFYSQSPHDNPTDGVLTVMASSIANAYAVAVTDHGILGDDIDGVVRTDIWEREIGA